MISDDYVSLEMTLEQVAAMRAILKLEHIHNTGAIVSSKNTFTDIQRIEATILLSDRWANLDRAFGVAMLNAALGNDPINLKTVLTVRIGKPEKVQIAELLYSGHYRETLADAKKLAGDYVKAFISVVLIDRNQQALKDIFLPLPKEDKPFVFDQVAPPKGVLN